MKLDPPPPPPPTLPPSQLGNNTNIHIKMDYNTAAYKLIIIIIIIIIIKYF